MSGGKQDDRKKGRRALWTIGGVLSLALIFVGPAWALTNLYAQPSRYAKDDFRALIRYIEQTAGEKDVLVYNNAVMLPFHAHYQQRDDLPVTAVPRYPHPAQAEDPELVALTRQYDRIWLVTDPPPTAGTMNGWCKPGWKTTCSRWISAANSAKMASLKCWPSANCGQMALRSNGAGLTPPSCAALTWPPISPPPVPRCGSLYIGKRL
ncbi:MAG: hypothetical protein M5U34_28065 [Chloroflexi bacterium]|nr:hypothetical protein [Chloroflexota bacterium]